MPEESRVPVAPRIPTPFGLLRPAVEDDAPSLLDYRIRNRTHLAPWEPARDATYHTLAGCVVAIAEADEAARLDRGYLLLMLSPDERRVLGTVRFANLVRGAFQACHLGYGLDASLQGRGLMREALDVALNWAFGELDLHRIMANYMPRNQRSAALLHALGFQREGYAPKYLKIAGKWEDHVLTAKVRRY
jgi:[ribosomal protein S5]-alanine N-acetyltransferase